MARIREMLVCFIILLFFITTIIPLDSFSENNYSPMSTSVRKARGVPEDEWACFKGDATRTGNSTAEGATRYHLLLSIATNVVYSSPIVQYDQIYVVYNGGTRCFNMSGSVVWTYNTGSLYSTPLVYNGRVYFAAGNGALHCVDANATGSGSTTNYWTYSPSGVRNAASSPVTDGEKIYYSTQHVSGLHAVWLSNGTKAWNASLGGSVWTESSPAYWNGRVYCGGGDSTGMSNDDLFCFNATNGALHWIFSTGQDLVSTPAIEYGRVYFGSMDEKVYCVDAIGSGGSTTKYWEYDTNCANSGIYCSPSVAYGRVYIGATNNHLYCLDALATGGSTTVYWDKTLTYPGSVGIYSSPVITPEHIYIGSSGYAIHCRNRTNGNNVWVQNYAGISYGMNSPAIYKDHLMVTADNGNLYIIGPDVTPPKVVSSSPTNGEIDVMLDTNISVKFSEDINLSHMTSSNFVLKDSQDNIVSGTLSADMNIDTVFFTPDSDLAKEETYNFTVKSDVTDIWGHGLDGNGNGIAEGGVTDIFGFSFTTIPFYPPSIGQVPILKPTEDVPFLMDFTAYLSDPDTIKANLTLTQDSEYGTLDGFELTLLYPEGILRDSINLTVSDGILSDYQILTVWVKPVNDAPVLGTIAPLELTEDVSYILNVTTYITDVDSPLANLTVYDSTYSKYVKVQGMEFNLTYPEGITEDTINITVYDSYEDQLRDSQELDISIEPVNDPPKIKQLPPVSVKEDEAFVYSVDEYISDVDTPKTTLIVLVDSPYVEVKGHELTLTYPDSVSTDILNVRVFDGEHYTNESLFVFVDPVNDPPIIISIDSPKDGEEFEHDDTIDFTAQVSDPDLIFGGDKLSFRWSSDLDGQFASTQNATGISLSSGKHKITLIVLDKEKERDTDSIEVTVKEKPEEPEPEKNDTPEKPEQPKDKDNDKNQTSTNDNNLGIIIAGVVVVIIILILLALLMIRRKKGKKPEAKEEAADSTVPPKDQLQPALPIQPLPQQFAPGQFPLDPSMMDPSIMFGQVPFDPTIQDPTMMYPQTTDQAQLQDTGLQGQALDQTQPPEIGQEPVTQFPEPQAVQPQLPAAEQQGEATATGEVDDWATPADHEKPNEIESPDDNTGSDPLQNASTFKLEGADHTGEELPDTSESPEPKKDSETE